MDIIKSDRLSKVSSQETKPLITIITAVYNAEKYINECILSILEQTYKNFEYIVIDGGSNDNSVNIISQYKDRLSYWISEPDQGIYDAWNKGLKHAKGDWIVFVGADDQLLPDALNIYVEHIINHPQCSRLEFISSYLDLVDENLTTIRRVGAPWTWESFKKEMVTWHVGCFHSKKLFIKYGIFDVSYKISGDYEFLLRPKDQLITSFIDACTVKMRTGGVSNVMLFKANEETHRAKIKNGIISPLKGSLLIKIDRFRLYVRKVTGWTNF